MGVQWDLIFGDSSSDQEESVLDRLERRQAEIVDRLDRYDRRLRPHGMPTLARLVDCWVSEAERKNRRRR